MAIEVRRATVEDEDWILRQLRDFDKFLGTKRSLIEDELAARKTILSLIANHIVLIAHEDSERHGFIAGARGPHPFAAYLNVLSELFWWIDPKHRGRGAALALLNEFEKVGRDGSDWIVFSLETHSPVRDAHLTGRGFRQIERAYLLET